VCCGTGGALPPFLLGTRLDGRHAYHHEVPPNHTILILATVSFPRYRYLASFQEIDVHQKYVHRGPAYWKTCLVKVTASLQFLVTTVPTV